MSHPFSGTGPGGQTPDGCSVALYRALPYLGELDEVLDVFQPGMAVLELGCGTGRLCQPLLDRGCNVTGVDESAEMLAALPAPMQAVQSRLQDLALPTRHDAVLLASHLINHPDAQVREDFVRCAARHLRAGGRLVLKRHNVDWLHTAVVGPAGQAGGSTLFVEAVARDTSAEPLLVHMRLRYELGDQAWRHAFSTVALAEAQVAEVLQRHGFRDIQWRGRQRLWAVAVASGD
jgi:SAM-dependent methyltransferase